MICCASVHLFKNNEYNLVVIYLFILWEAHTLTKAPLFNPFASEQALFCYLINPDLIVGIIHFVAVLQNFKAVDRCWACRNEAEGGRHWRRTGTMREWQEAEYDQGSWKAMLDVY